MQEVKKILVVRNDKIGDFVLALPAIQVIKEAFPDATLTALVPGYTQDIAKVCSSIDNIIIDPKDPKKKKELIKTLREEGFDAVICLFSNSYNATLVRKARIPVRVAPATKLVQFLYTHTLRQRRSKSEKPEFQYNLDLAYYFIGILGGRLTSAEPQKTLSFSPKCLAKQKEKLRALGIRFEYKLCFIHPVTGGSSNTLVSEQWQTLIRFLNELDQFHFVISAGPGEEPVSKALYENLQGQIKHLTLYDKNDGVADFMRSIALADLFIAGSTGPLHIAGALDVPTIGFYPKRRSSIPLRWKTLNSEGRWLPFSPNAQQEELPQVEIESLFESIRNWYRQLTGKQ